MNNIRDNKYNKYKIAFNADFWYGVFIGWIILIIIGLVFKALSVLNLVGL